VPHALVGDFVDAHRLRLELAQVKKHHLERQAFRAPQGVVGAEADVAILIVGERLQLRRRRALGALVRALGLTLRQFGDVIEAERGRRSAVQK
jgi:hypothetical protein